MFNIELKVNHNLMNSKFQEFETVRTLRIKEKAEKFVPKKFLRIRIIDFLLSESIDKFCFWML